MVHFHILSDWTSVSDVVGQRSSQDCRTCNGSNDSTSNRATGSRAARAMRSTGSSWIFALGFGRWLVGFVRHGGVAIAARNDERSAIALVCETSRLDPAAFAHLSARASIGNRTNTCACIDPCTCSRWCVTWRSGSGKNIKIDVTVRLGHARDGDDLGLIASAQTVRTCTCDLGVADCNDCANLSTNSHGDIGRNSSKIRSDDCNQRTGNSSRAWLSRCNRWIGDT